MTRLPPTSLPCCSGSTGCPSRSSWRPPEPGPCRLPRSSGGSRSGGPTRSTRIDGDRHRSLRAILDWTLGLLSPKELETLEAVSVCAGFDFDLAQALAPDIDVVDAIESLVTLASSRPQGRSSECLASGCSRRSGPRCCEGLTEERLHALEDRHARKFLDLAEDWDRQSIGGWTPDLVERLDADADNIRRALDRLDAADPRRSLALGCRLDAFWHTRGRLAEGLGRFERTSALAPEPSVELARATGRYLALASGEVGPSASRALTDRAIEMARAVADPSALIAALRSRMLINLVYEEGDVAAAVAAEAEIEGLDLIDLDARTRMVLTELKTWLAGVKYGLESDQYVDQTRAQLAEASQAGWVGEQAIVACNLARTLLLRGEHDEAATMTEEAARVFRGLARPAELGWALSYRGAALAWLDRTSEAVDAAIEAAVIAAALPRPLNVAGSAWTAIQIALATEQPLLAARLWGAMRSMHNRGDYVLAPIDLRTGEGWLARAARAAPDVAIELALREGAAEDPLELLRALPELLRRSAPASTPTAPPPWWAEEARGRDPRPRRSGQQRSEERGGALHQPEDRLRACIQCQGGGCGVETRLEAALWARDRGLVEGEAYNT